VTTTATRNRSPEYRDRLAACWREHLDVATVAAELGLTAAAVRTGVSRIRQAGWDLPYAPRAREQATPEDLRAWLRAAKVDARKGVPTAARTVRILELRIAGQTHEEIARIVGVSPACVSKSTKAPGHIRAQAVAYRQKGHCVNCGEPTTRTTRYDPAAPNRHRAVTAPAERCAKCAREARWGHETWTKDTIAAELKAMARHLDRVPKVSDLTTPDSPFGITTVYRVFGKTGFRKALRYAGLSARKVGGQTREDEAEMVVTWEQRRTVLRLGGSLTFDGNTVEQSPPPRRRR
jgi:predicted transcriptional regulator